MRLLEYVLQMPARRLKYDNDMLVTRLFNCLRMARGGFLGEDQVGVEGDSADLPIVYFP